MPGMVTVGCKLPNGIILQRYSMDEATEPLMGGGSRVVKRAAPQGERIKINGCARRPGVDAPHLIVHGAGITSNVDADFFADWLKQNQDQ